MLSISGALQLRAFCPWCIGQARSVLTLSVGGTWSAGAERCGGADTHEGWGNRSLKPIDLCTKKQLKHIFLVQIQLSHQEFSGGVFRGGGSESITRGEVGRLFWGGALVSQRGHLSGGEGLIGPPVWQS